jgi:hypothetical protein
VSAQGRPERGSARSQDCELTQEGSADKKASQRLGAHNGSELTGSLGSAGREHSQDWVLSAGARTHAKRVQRKDKAKANSPTGGVRPDGKVTVTPT